MKLSEKSIRFSACVLSAFILASCGEKTDSEPVHTESLASETGVTELTENTSETTSVKEETAESTSVTEESSETAEQTVISAAEYIPNEEERRQIQELLGKCKSFFYDYIDCKEICKYTDKNSTVTTREVIDNGMYAGQTSDRIWYEVTDGEVLTMADLNDKMSPLFTDKMIGDIGTEISNDYYEENGKLYLSDAAGSNGGLLGTDTVHITSVGEVDEDTLVLYMTAFGAGENWDLDHDTVMDFAVLIERSDGGFKMDECDFAARGYIEWCYTPEDDIFEVST